MNTGDDRIRALAAARWRIAIALSGAVFLLYFGFIFAVAFAQGLMAREVAPGLSVGILAGALVIVGAWLTTWVYVRWANLHFDRQRGAIDGDGQAG
ncbi:MAG: DUF485 domain-containing protein [Gammaproteobacteria bacterium]|nr:DUF485 domain-containing protein [Gammaproteobacteria bacterium]